MSRNGCILAARSPRPRRSRPPRPIPISRFRRRAAAAAPRRRASGLAACGADPADAAESRRNSQARFAPAAPSRNSGLSRRDARAPISPIRPDRRETRRAASSASASARVGTTIGRAVPRPYVNEAAGVFGLFAVGVAQTQRAPVDVKRQGFVVEGRRQRACGLKPRDRGAALPARAANAPMGREPLDHERGGGQDERRLSGAAADETGQRQHGREGHDQREGGQRRHVAGEQSALERRAQPCASGGGFGFGGRKRESVGPERIRGAVRRHGSPGALATSASACRPSANSAVRRS